MAVRSEVFSESTKPQWTEAGMACHASQADCANCDIYKIHGLHRLNQGEKRCHQPDSNHRLLQNGIKPNVTLKPVKLEIPPEKKRPPGFKLSENQGAIFRAEIVNKILPAIETPTVREILKHLNSISYLGYADWAYTHVSPHLKRMKAAGVLKVVGYEMTDSKTEILAVADPKKLAGMIRKNYKPLQMPQMVFNTRPNGKDVKL